MKFSEREKLKADFFETFGIGKGYIGYSDVNTDFYGNDFFVAIQSFLKLLTIWKMQIIIILVITAKSTWNILV